MQEEAYATPAEMDYCVLSEKVTDLKTDQLLFECLCV